MRFLIDSCVWRPVVDQLRAAGHDVDAVHEWAGDPGDDAILECAAEERRVLVTLDKDFGELVFVMGAEHEGIVRLVDVRARDQGQALLDVVARYREELERRALVVVSPNRVRIRMPE